MRLLWVALVILLASACSPSDQRPPVETFGFYPPKGLSDDTTFLQTQEVAKSIGFVALEKMHGITDDSTAMRFKTNKGASLLITHDPSSQCFQASFQTPALSQTQSQDRFDTLKAAGKMRKALQGKSWAIGAEGCPVGP